MLWFLIQGYYNGVPGDADDDSINSGGQCEDGPKMIVVIGEVLVTLIDPAVSTLPALPGLILTP